MFNNEQKIYQNSNTFRTQPKANWKIVIFDQNEPEVNGEQYWFERFINSNKFIIHEVNSVIDVSSGLTRRYHQVWYEEK